MSKTDEGAQSFAKFCHAAGAQKCAFYDKSECKIMTRVHNILENMQKGPISVSDQNFTASPRLVTYEEILFIMFMGVYSPAPVFPIVAQLFADLEHRNGSSLALALQDGSFDPSALNYGGLIACMDAPGRYNLSTIEKWEAHVKKVNKISEFGGDAFASVPLLCRTMDIVPPKSQQFFGTPSAKKY